MGIKSVDKAIYVGNFKERQYDFFESFRYNQHKDYYELPFELKFGGIRPFPSDSTGKKDYSWLRKLDNLRIAFNAFSTIGLDKFVSEYKYFESHNDWCCDTEWENKSLNDIVIGFIKPDTTSKGADYLDDDTNGWITENHYPGANRNLNHKNNEMSTMVADAQPFFP